MRVHFERFGLLQFSNADGTVTYRHEAGDDVDLPKSVAMAFIAHGVASPAKCAPVRATAPARATADKPRSRRKE